MTTRQISESDYSLEPPWKARHCLDCSPRTRLLEISKDCRIAMDLWKLACVPGSSRFNPSGSMMIGNLVCPGILPTPSIQSHNDLEDSQTSDHFPGTGLCHSTVVGFVFWKSRLPFQSVCVVGPLCAASIQKGHIRATRNTSLACRCVVLNLLLGRRIVARMGKTHEREAKC
jgi:hypothetical protein